MDTSDFFKNNEKDLGTPTSVRTWVENGVTITEKIWETESGTVKIIEAKRESESQEYDDESTEGFINMGNIGYKIDEASFIDPFSDFKMNDYIEKMNDIFNKFINNREYSSDIRFKRSLNDIGKSREMTVDEEIDLIDTKIAFAAKEENYEKAAQLKKRKEELMANKSSSDDKKD